MSFFSLKFTRASHKKKHLCKEEKKSFSKLKNSVNYAYKIGLEVHVGHGLTYKSTERISKIKKISEFNIGHFLIAESIFLGLNNTIKKFKKIINN